MGEKRKNTQHDVITHLMQENASLRFQLDLLLRVVRALDRKCNETSAALFDCPDYQMQMGQLKELLRVSLQTIDAIVPPER